MKGYQRLGLCWMIGIVLLPITLFAEEMNDTDEIDEQVGFVQSFESLKQDVIQLQSEAKQLLSEAQKLSDDIKQEKANPSNRQAVVFLLWNEFNDIENKANQYVKNPGQYNFDFPSLVSKGVEIVSMLKDMGEEQSKLVSAEDKLGQWKSIESVAGNDKS